MKMKNSFQKIVKAIYQIKSSFLVQFHKAVKMVNWRVQSVVARFSGKFLLSNYKKTNLSVSMKASYLNLEENKLGDCSSEVSLISYRAISFMEWKRTLPWTQVKLSSYLITITNLIQTRAKGRRRLKRSWARRSKTLKAALLNLLGLFNSNNSFLWKYSQRDQRYSLIRCLSLIFNLVH